MNGLDDIEEVVGDPNFDHRAQAAFDSLNDGTDWTWTGLARAFSRRYELSDMQELKNAIDMEIAEAIR
jgi:hypothetical protein